MGSNSENHKNSVLVRKEGDTRPQLNGSPTARKPAKRSCPQSDGFGLEIFSGCGRLSATIVKAGLPMKPVDWAGNRHIMEARAVSIDLTKVEGQELLWGLVRDINCKYVHEGPPCGTFSRSREIPLPAWLKAQGVKDPKPLRSLEHVRGIPGLDAEEAQRVKAANALADLAADIGIFCAAKGIPFSIENPSRSWLWHMPKFQELLKMPGVLAIDGQACMAGSKRDKWTKFVSNIPELKILGQRCDGSHEHASWKYSFQTGFATGEEAEYPAKMCEMIADAVCSHIGYVHRNEGEFRPVPEKDNKLISSVHRNEGILSSLRKGHSAANSNFDQVKESDTAG